MGKKKVLMVLLIIGILIIGISSLKVFFFLNLNKENLDPICPELKSLIYQEIQNLNYCNTLNDCTKRWVEAPATDLGCETYLLNKNANLSNIKSLFSRYRNSCSSKRGMLSCGSMVPIQFTFLDCQENKCTLNWTTDESICELFDDKIIKNNCYEKIAIIKTNLNLCDKIENQIIKEQCILSIRTKLSHNLSLCNDKNDKDSCYESMALNLYDLSICDEIIENSVRYNCYNQMAYRNHDPSICKKIPILKEYDKMRKRCESSTRVMFIIE